MNETKNKKQIYKVMIGYSPIYFVNKDEAMKVFDLLSSSISRVNIDSAMLDKFTGKDYSGYEYLYYINTVDPVTLTSEEMNIVPQQTALDLKEQRTKEREEFEKKKQAGTTTAEEPKK